MRPHSPRRSRLRRLLPILLPITAVIFAACATGNPQDTFTTAGPVARDQAWLFRMILWIAVVVFVLVEGTLVYITIRYRRRPGDKMPVQTHGNNKLEITWTVIPALILVGIAIPTIFQIWDLNEPPEGSNPLQVEAIGHQWWFEFRYPSEEIVTANELHIPVGRPIVFKLTSDDVIHSFWVPNLAGKVDMVPINENTLWFQADEAGTFFGQCAEFCGLAHAMMRFRVIAESQEDFDAWVKSMGTAPDAPAANSGEENGRDLFARNCSTCHSTDGYRDGGYQAEIALQAGRWSGWLADPENAAIVSAPSLTHFGLRNTFGAGIEELTRENLITWINDPSEIKIGTRMQKHAAIYDTPDRTARLERQEIIDIADYLLSLVPGKGGDNGSGASNGGSDVQGLDGQALFAANGCSGCHSTGADRVVGPGLAGVGESAGNRVSGLSAEEYIAQSLRDPTAYVVDDFAPVMPSFARLSDDEIEALVKYLRTLN